MHKPKYLVRPDDYHIFEIDESNGCYRSYMNKDVTYLDGTRPKAQPHFTFENLTQNYGFYPINESEIPAIEERAKFMSEFISWHNRPDGHGGVKGGTMVEYLEHLENVKRYQQLKIHKAEDNKPF